MSHLVVRGENQTNRILEFRVSLTLQQFTQFYIGCFFQTYKL